MRSRDHFTPLAKLRAHAPGALSGGVHPALWLLAAGLVVLYWGLDFQIWGDGAFRFQMLRGVLEGAPMPSVRQYSLVGPLLSAPLYWLGHLVESPQWWCARFNFVVFLVGASLLFRALHTQASVDTRLRFVLCLTFCSMFPAHLEHYYGEVLSALGLALGCVWIEHPRRAAWGWLLAGLAVVNTPGLGLGLALLVLTRIARSGRVRVLLVLPATVAVIALDNFVRTGSWLGGYVGNVYTKTIMPYSGLPTFSYPLGFGLMNILFSSGKGLVWFIPGLWLAWAFYRDERLGASPELKRVVTLWLSVLVGMVLLYARWHMWYGGWFWGPRFFLLGCIPASMMLAVALSAPAVSMSVRVLAMAALTLAYWGGVNGVVFKLTTSGICQRDDEALIHLCNSVPEFSPLWRPFVVSTYVPAAKGALWGYATCVYAYLVLPHVRAVAVALRGWWRQSVTPRTLRW